MAFWIHPVTGIHQNNPKIWSIFFIRFCQTFFVVFFGKSFPTKSQNFNIKAQHLVVAILNSSQFQGSNKLWRWQNCDNFLIFKIVSMPKIFKFCNLKHFNHRKNLKDWEIVTIWSNQIISTICLKVEIVKNLKLPQLGVVLWFSLSVNYIDKVKKQILNTYIASWGSLKIVKKNV